MTGYFLDSSILFAAASGEHVTLARLARLEGSDVATSAVVWSELMAAAPEKDRRLAENLRLIGETIDILPFDRAAAEAFGALLHELEPKRRRVLDRMVAAQARALDRRLATLIPADYKDIHGLTVEDWSARSLTPSG
jgi:tRNA(fMet)-specific endonuclease VapC